MKRSSSRMIAAALVAVTANAACRTTSPEPAPAGASAGGARRGHTAADAQFMQHMLAHHAQALTMTGLVPGRSTRQDIRLLAQRIEVSQRDEIAMMRRWLQERGEEVPSLEAHHAHGAAGGHHSGMPGMLTAEELARLTRAKGDEFDRLFLQYMIRHHEGALTMVAQFLATPGAAQESETFRFASDVDADQRAEIRRMRTLPGAPPNDSRR